MDQIKKDYYNLDWENDEPDKIFDKCIEYIKLLESQNSNLLTFKDENKKLKEYNKEMLNFIKDICINDIGSKYKWVFERSKEIIEKIENNTLNEIFKNYG